MGVRTLPDGLIGLIQHVELNQSGWWRKAVGEIVGGLLYTADRPLESDEIRTELEGKYGVLLSTAEFDKSVDVMLSKGELLRVPPRRLKISEGRRQELDRLAQEATSKIQSLRARFLADVGAECKEDPDPNVWNALLESLRAAIAQIGANTYRLLIDSRLERNIDWTRTFAQKGHVGRDCVFRAVSNFLEPKDADVRWLILKELSAHFFLEATQLRPESIQLLDSNRKTTKLRLILDTNFLFSVLGLHDNPSDDASKALLALTEENKGRLAIQICVLETTLDEAERTLNAYVSLLEDYHYSYGISIAATKMRLASIPAKFFAENARCGGGMSPRDFFGPYLKGLRFVLKERGIDILEWPTDHYMKRQDIIDDLNVILQQERAKQNRKQKNYETIAHDLILWNAIAEHRSPTEGTPLEIENWGVSLDWRVIGYDEFKRRKMRLRFPVVLHPTTMSQMLQFWVPRTDALEESMVSALRLPLLFYNFDADDERVTVEILKALARFENVDDLGEDTIVSILADQALRERLKRSDDVGGEAKEVIRETLFALHKQVVTERDEALSRATRTEESRQEIQAKADRLSGELARVQEAATSSSNRAREMEKAIDLLQYDLALEEERRNDTEREKAAVEEELRAIRERASADSFLLKYWIVAPAALVFICYSAWWGAREYASSWGAVIQWITFVFVSAGSFAIWTLRGSREAMRSQYLSALLRGRTIIWLHERVVIGVGGLAFSGVFQGGVWDGLKKLMGI